MRAAPRRCAPRRDLDARPSGALRCRVAKIVNRDKDETLGNTPTGTGPDDDDTALPGVVVVFSGAGHYSFLEQPYLFAKVIKSFLNIGD